MKPKFRLGDIQITFCDKETEQPLLVVENPDIEINTKGITFKDEEVFNLVFEELKMVSMVSCVYFRI